MLKFFYFSGSDLRYRKLGWRPIASFVIIPVILSAVLTLVGSRFGFDPFRLENLRTASMSRENSTLKSRLASLNGKLNDMQAYMNRLGNSDDLLRTSVDLPFIPPDQRKASIGGVAENPDYGVSSSANTLISDASKSLDALEREAKLQEGSYADIMKKYKSNQRLFGHIPAIDPIQGGGIIDGFGMRFHPILHVRIMHEGIDLDAPFGSQVHATGDGVVTYVGRRGGYGKLVEIDHGFGYTTLYAHLSKYLVREGEKVKRGQVIALSGDTGMSTGPHLHYGVEKDGVFVDPTHYFFDGRQFDSPKFYSQLAGK